MSQVVVLKREQLREPKNPIRVDMSDEKMQELIDSIKARGILYPLVVHRAGFRLSDGSFTDDVESVDKVEGTLEAYEIRDGHRRFIACGQAAVTELPCIVRDGDGDSALDDMLTANLCREDNSPAEEGWVYARLAFDEGWDMNRLMRTFHRSEGYINSRVKLVSTDGEVAKAVHAKEISFGVAQQLVMCDDEAHRRYLLSLCKTHGASIKTAMSYIQQWRTSVELGKNVPVHSASTEQFVYTPPPPQVCSWCEQDRDRDSLISVVFHRWHYDDYLDWRKATRGANPSGNS